jgi:ribosome-associated protein
LDGRGGRGAGRKPAAAPGLKNLSDRRTVKLYPKKKALEIARHAQDKHASDVVILKIRPLSTVSDYLLICSAESERQVAAIVEAIEDGLKKKGERPLGVEGAEQGRWALMDYNDVVAHIFLAPVRTFYNLEGLWADADAVEVMEPARKKKAK